MKTTFLKNGSNERVYENSYLKPIRLLVGYENNGVGIVVHNISYGANVYIDVLDTETKRVVERFSGAQLHDIKKETEYGKKIIAFVANYQKHKL